MHGLASREFRSRGRKDQRIAKACLLLHSLFSFGIWKIVDLLAPHRFPESSLSYFMHIDELGGYQQVGVWIHLLGPGQTFCLMMGLHASLTSSRLLCSFLSILIEHQTRLQPNYCIVFSWSGYEIFSVLSCLGLFMCMRIFCHFFFLLCNNPNICHTKDAPKRKLQDGILTYRIRMNLSCSSPSFAAPGSFASKVLRSACVED